MEAQLKPVVPFSFQQPRPAAETARATEQLARPTLAALARAELVALVAAALGELVEAEPALAVEVLVVVEEAEPAVVEAPIPLGLIAQLQPFDAARCVEYS